MMVTASAGSSLTVAVSLKCSRVSDSSAGSFAYAVLVVRPRKINGARAAMRFFIRPHVIRPAFTPTIGRRGMFARSGHRRPAEAFPLQVRITPPQLDHLHPLTI